jgi:hypothetical protein
MDKLADPNQPLTVSILRAALEQLEAAGHGNTPVSLYTGAEASRLIQAHNIAPDRSIADRPHSAALAHCSTWDASRQTGVITNFVIL